jgi:glycosyltransferase involved in cell wall biosynthesis
MSCGLPILSSQYNGCWPELVQPGNGWVFDPLDPRDIQRCLQLALESRANLPAMGQCSRQIVREYSPAHAAGAIFRACEIAVEHGKRR